MDTLNNLLLVIPAKAGIQFLLFGLKIKVDSGFRRNDGLLLA